MLSLETLFQLFLATLLGGAIGLEREYQRKEAGLRTYILVCLGAALFTIIGVEIFNSFGETKTHDLIRIIQAVAIGVGFIGAGLIVFKESHVQGLTTAAGLWVAAAVGVALGVKLYFQALFTTFLTIGVLAGLRLLEEKLFDQK